MTDGEQPDSRAGDDQAEPREAYNWRRHVPRVVLLIGLAVAALELGPTLPHDQTLVFRLASGLQPVKRLEATWTRYGADEPTGGVTLRFPDEAPSHVRHRLKVPNGEYVLAIVLDAGAGDISRLPR